MQHCSNAMCDLSSQSRSLTAADETCPKQKELFIENNIVEVEYGLLLATGKNLRYMNEVKQH